MIEPVLQAGPVGGAPIFRDRDDDSWRVEVVGVGSEALQGAAERDQDGRCLGRRDPRVQLVEQALERKRQVVAGLGARRSGRADLEQLVEQRAPGGRQVRPGFLGIGEEHRSRRRDCAGQGERGSDGGRDDDAQGWLRDTSVVTAPPPVAASVAQSARRASSPRRSARPLRKPRSRRPRPPGCRA